MKRIRLFEESVAIASYIEKQDENKIVFFDEGLLQRGISLGIIGIEDDIIKEYYKYVPEPDLVIYFTGNINTINSRLTKRDGKDSEFFKYTQRSIEVTKICLEIMKERNINIIKVNAELPFEEQWKLVKDELSKLISS